MTDKQNLTDIIQQGKENDASPADTANAVLNDGWVKTTVIQSIEELENIPPYIPVRFDIHGTNGWATGSVLAHKSPNGIWWSTRSLPDKATELWEFCNGKATAYWDGTDSTASELEY